MITLFENTSVIVQGKVKLEGPEGDPIRLQRMVMLFFMIEDLVAHGRDTIVLFLKGRRRERNAEKAPGRFRTSRCPEGARETKISNSTGSR